MNVLLNSSFTTAYDSILELKTQEGLSLVDIVVCLHELVSRVKMAPSVMAFVLVELANIEYALATDTSDKVQLGALIGIFQLAKQMSIDAVKSEGK
jgi:replication factor C subunit 3/5